MLIVALTLSWFLKQIRKKVKGRPIQKVKPQHCGVHNVQLLGRRLCKVKSKGRQIRKKVEPQHGGLCKVQPQVCRIHKVQPQGCHYPQVWGISKVKLQGQQICKVEQYGRWIHSQGWAAGTTMVHLASVEGKQAEALARAAKSLHATSCHHCHRSVHQKEHFWW
jgi:hypothetical protein